MSHTHTNFPPIFTSRIRPSAAQHVCQFFLDMKRWGARIEKGGGCIFTLLSRVAGPAWRSMGPGWVGLGFCVCVCVWEREREREGTKYVRRLHMNESHFYSIALFWQKSHVNPQKSHINPQKSHINPPKSHINPQKSHMCADYIWMSHTFTV